MRPALLLALLLTLSACVNPAEHAARVQQVEAADHAECARLGFAPGSPPYGDCRLRLREMRLQERVVNRPVYVDPYFSPRFSGHVYR